jgi:multiple sugar transport system permease protein
MNLEKPILQDSTAPPAAGRFNPFALPGLLSERRHWAYILIAPSLILVLIIVIYPVVSGVFLSFREMRLNRPNLGTGFVGFRHYIELLSDTVFLQALMNTVIWVVAGALTQFALGLVAALALHRPIRGMRIARVLILLPWLLPTVVAGNMWALMLDSRLGVINDILLKLGLITSYKAWFASPETALPMALVVALWQGFPFFTLLLLAGLDGIPDDLYEAASVDGANRWQQFWHITLPMLRPIIVAVVVLRVIGLVNSPDLVLILTGGGPGNSTQLLSLYAFKTAYNKFDFGYAGALSVVMLLLLLVFTIIYVRVSGVTKE